MQNAGVRPSKFGLDQHGLRNWDVAHWNLGGAKLVEFAIQRHEGVLANNGALVVRTGHFTGRSPRDKFIVRDQTTESQVNWGPVNQPMTEENFDRLYAKVLAHWQGGEVFVQDCLAGADPAYTLPLRVITGQAWHSLFGRQLFIRPGYDQLEDHVPQFTLMFVPRFQASPEEDGTNSSTCIVINFKRRLVLIRWHQLRGRNEEVGVHDPELSAAGARRVSHALLGERRVEDGERGAVLRPVGHRQNDAVRRSAARADRRRRARLERHGRVQLRGRLLRQVHQALAQRTSRRSGTRSGSARCWRTS